MKRKEQRYGVDGNEQCFGHYVNVASDISGTDSVWRLAAIYHRLISRMNKFADSFSNL